MRNDEFNSQTSEYTKLPDEDNLHKKEFNEDYWLKREQKKKEEKKQEEKQNNKLKKRLLTYLTGACVGVSIMTSTGDFSLNQAQTEPYVYSYECHERAYVEEIDDCQLCVLIDGRVQSNGSVWSPEPVEVSTGIILEFDYLTAGGMKAEDFGAASGDGLAVNFVIPENLDLSNAHNGGEFGFIGDYGVEIDYFKNPFGEIRGQKDYYEEHISVVDSELNHLNGTENLKLTGLCWYHVRVEYIPTESGRIRISGYINDILYAQSEVDNISENVYVGISTANGDGNGYTVISNLRMNNGRVYITGTVNEEKIICEKLTELSILPPFMGGTLSEPGRKDDLRVIPYGLNVSPETLPEETITLPEDTKEPDETYISEDDSKDEDIPEEVQGVCGFCYGTLKCNACNGNGQIQCDNLSSSCGICHGSGVINCDKCYGSGECPYCNGSGTGTVVVNTELHNCEDCNGTGIICGGSAAADDPDGCGGRVTVSCKACNGTGKEKNGKVCSWCKGTLYHLCPSFEVHKTCDKCKGKGYYFE